MGRSRLIVRNREQADAFTTLDGSTIRVLLDASFGGAANQSLAEATLAPGQSTQRHYHAETEELYVLLAGVGEMEVEGERARVEAGDAVLIPPGAWHQIQAASGGELCFLCCCTPPYRDEDTFFK
jgi:mannose-6-phosphate isomerase-like protein (cupin superfamily)